jgi:hypothetical protein
LFMTVCMYNMVQSFDYHWNRCVNSSSGERLTDDQVDEIIRNTDLQEDLEGNVKYEGTCSCCLWLIFYYYTSRSRFFHSYGVFTRAATFWPTLGAQGYWAGRNLYRFIQVCCDQGSRFFWSHPKDRSLRSLRNVTYFYSVPYGVLIQSLLTVWCWGPFLKRILTVQYSLWVHYWYSKPHNLYVQLIVGNREPCQSSVTKTPLITTELHVRWHYWHFCCLLAEFIKKVMAGPFQ